MGTYKIDEIYFALETGFLNLSGGVPDPMGVGDVKIAFNPIHGNINVPKPKLIDKIQRTSDMTKPNVDVSFTEKMEEGSGIFPNEEGMDYRDPFLMLAFFTHKVVSGTWGTPAQYGKIVGDFSALDNESTIMMQYGNTDGTTPINRCLNGGMIEDYILGFKVGSILKEKVRLKTSVYSTNTQAFSTSGGFDDGKWSLWALAGATCKLYPATSCKLFWDESHAAELAGLKIQDCEFRLSRPRTSERYTDKLYAQEQWDKEKNFVATIKGILHGNPEYLEVEKLFENKIKKDLRLQWDETVDEEKWLQIDDAWIVELDSETLYHAGDRRKVAFTFAGSDANFEGNYLYRPDPNTRIDTT